MKQEYGQAMFRLERLDGETLQTVQEVAIGQPWRCVLSVVHDPADGLPESLTAPFPPGEDWVLLHGPVVRGQALEGGGWRSTATWEYMALQPGAHTTGDYELTLLRGAQVQPEPASLSVLHELAAEESSPRPLADALPVPPDPGGVGAWILLGALVLGLAAWLFSRWRRRTTSETPAPQATATQRLQQVTWSEEEGRECLFAWHRELRRAVDEVAEARGEARIAVRPTWTDDAWIAAGPGVAAMSPGLWERWCELLRELERLKYDAHLPSRLTGEELQVRVRRAAEEWQREQSASASGTVQPPLPPAREVPA